MVAMPRRNEEGRGSQFETPTVPTSQLEFFRRARRLVPSGRTALQVRCSRQLLIDVYRFIWLNRPMSTDPAATRQVTTFAIEAALDLIQDDFAVVISAELALERAQAGQRASVLAARDVGTSWESVGEVFGISKQAAQQRFGD